MKMRLVFIACWLVTLVSSHFAQGQTLTDCAKAYAFTYVVSNPNVMGDSRIFVLSDVNPNPESNIVTNKLYAYRLSSAYISYQVQQSPDMGVDIPWSNTVFDDKNYFISYNDVPYFESDLFSGIVGSVLSTNNTMFFRVHYTCTSTTYFSESDLIGYCTNSLGFPASLFE
ncbi:MAG: hypothetical protein K9M54_02480 [Kiritimatiellales bacterium]|nr:hypothetical protein [Kiritimatiellales bacterium]